MGKGSGGAARSKPLPSPLTAFPSNSDSQLLGERVHIWEVVEVYGRRRRYTVQMDRAKSLDEPGLLDTVVSLMWLLQQNEMYNGEVVTVVIVTSRIFLIENRRSQTYTLLISALGEPSERPLHLLSLAMVSYAHFTGRSLFFFFFQVVWKFS